jgi:hypothetical protein
MTKEVLNEFFKVSEKEANVLRCIGWFYHDMLCDTDFGKIEHYIRELGIHKVSIEEDTIFICLERPGLFIGERGSNINAFKKFLVEHESSAIDYKIHLIEIARPPMDYMTSYQYAYMNWNDL